MATTTLKTRIVLNNKTAAEWAENASFVALKGEVLLEVDTRKIKVGDGATSYDKLAYVNLTPEEVQSLITAANHSHSNKAILDATTASFTDALKTKLDSIAAGANKTIVDSAMSSSSTNPVQNKVVQAALDGKVPTTRKVNGKPLSSDITLSAGDVSAIAASAKGAANGVASLGADGKVPSTQLPSYVDDVLEGYVSDDLKKFYKDSAKSSEYTGETGKIYVDMNNNKTYRWSGSIYVVISETLALGTTASTAFAGDKGLVAYNHSQAAHAPSNAEKNIIVGIQKNGADLSVDASRKVNITVPTKTSELTNNSGFITSSANVASATKLATARAIDGVNFDGSAAITHFGTCSTAAGTAAKVVSLTSFTLVTGARITIKFTVTNTAASPTLNVNGTGAKPIVYRGSAIAAGYLAANRVYEFVYDGTNYALVGDIDTNTNTTYSAGAGLTLNGTKFEHTNSVTAGTAKGDDSKTLSYGGTFTIPSVTYDAQGHITAKSTTTMTMPAVPSNVASATKLQSARNFSITGGATAAAVSFNGTADVSLNVTSLNAIKLTVADSDTLILDGSI
nr:MAG TPA: hyaluronidase [Caudoviricetes sp.]DAL00892.1 MAG TPA: hyaluronidase [Caudoviricetes sp.]